MKRKIKSVKGFTLAELLIVVAIIAVLVAIGIPIFTSQLEKSREAVDLSDVRSAYAEVMMAAITGDTTAYYTKDANQTIYKTSAETFNGYTVEAGAYSITVTPLKQKQPGWQTAEPITIGGVSSKAGVPYWNGQPGLDGYCIVTYHPPVGSNVEYVSFYWSGGNDSSNSTVTPTPNLWITPVPTVIPTQIPTPTQAPNNNYVVDYPPEPEENQNNYIYRGWAYKYSDGKTYVVTQDQTLVHGQYYIHPGYVNTEYLYAELTGKTLTVADDKVDMENGVEKRRLGPVKRGDVYYDGKNYYVRLINSEDKQSEPPTIDHDESRWLLIKNYGS